MEHLLTVILVVPLLGVFFASLSREDGAFEGRNVLSVGIFTIITNLALLWLAAQHLDVHGDKWQLTESFDWLENPNIDLVFGLDIFSLLLIAAVHIAILLGMIGVRNNKYRQKSLIIFALLFLTMISGYFMATDLFSFYIFFEAMLLPLFMLVGIFGDVKRRQMLYRFFLYNLFGALCLFMALVILYHERNVGIKEVGTVIFGGLVPPIIWLAVMIALFSRIPIWPFHYWVASINAQLTNPLVFIIANLMPLTGVYGFVRFFPVQMPAESAAIMPYMNILQWLGLVSMVIIAVIGLTKRDIQYKLFCYMSICYIARMLTPYESLLALGIFLFAFLLIIAAIEVLVNHIEEQKHCNDISECGILGNIPRASFAFSFLILAAIGMPLSFVFLNNLLVYRAFDGSRMGFWSILLSQSAFILAAIGLLQQLFYLRYSFNESSTATADISPAVWLLILGIIGMLLLSFVNPLWFIL